MFKVLDSIKEQIQNNSAKTQIKELNSKVRDLYTYIDLLAKKQSELRRIITFGRDDAITYHSETVKNHRYFVNENNIIEQRYIDDESEPVYTYIYKGNKEYLIKNLYMYDAIIHETKKENTIHAIDKSGTYFIEYIIDLNEKSFTCIKKYPVEYST